MRNKILIILFSLALITLIKVSIMNQLRIRTLEEELKNLHAIRRQKITNPLQRTEEERDRLIEDEQKQQQRFREWVRQRNEVEARYQERKKGNPKKQ
ncbi:MAG: hypothetical protein ACYS0I_14475 [Planctomycetota bacterium]